MAMCDLEQIDDCEVWIEREVTARRDHRCKACGGEIRAGERYLRHFSVTDGRPTAEKVCQHCQRDRAEFAEAHDNLSPVPSEFKNLLHLCIIDGDTTDQERWTPMLDRLKARRPATLARQKDG